MDAFGAIGRGISDYAGSLETWGRAALMATPFGILNLPAQMRAAEDIRGSVEDVRRRSVDPTGGEPVEMRE
jgi:hypothetical protein